MSDHVCKLGPAPAETPVADDEPTFGLTPKEKQILKDSWSLVRQDAAGNGVVVLVTFFRDYPHNLHYFPFKDVPIDALENEPLVKSHAIRVIRDLSFCIDNINKPNTVLHALEQNALNHRRRNIQKVSYDELRLSVLKALLGKLGREVFTEELEALWDKTLKVIFGAILGFMADGQCHCKKYFRDYPQNLRYFPFKIDRIEDLENEPLVKLHSLRVMRELNFCVENMDRQETLLHALRQNALNHRKRSIHRTAYDDLRMSILKALSHQLGPEKFKPESAHAWDKALRVLFQVITDINDERKCNCPNPNRPDYHDVGMAGTSKRKR